jgi:general secretion pathway protein B
MSFILDALRKSEHDRQRQSGPGLAELPVAVARPRTNAWASAAIVLLIVNLIAVGVLLLRRAHRADPVSNTAVAASASAPAVALVAASAAPSPQASLTRTLPQPMLQEPPPAAPDPVSRNPLESEVSAGAQDIDAGMARQAASVPAGPPAVSPAQAGRGSVAYQPLPDSAVAAQSAAASVEQAGLPTADEVTARGGVPELHLDLHVYSTRAQERFIFVNSRKYREGETLQEGPVVEQITPGGAVLNYRGSRFVLSRD